MYILVVGGGKVGYYLTKTLVNEGHEILLIEKNAQKVQIWRDRFGSVVLQGDGCEVTTLEQAGAGRADVVIAVTGGDEDNLVICQVAKQRFHVRKTIARVNNPKNEDIFRRLGVDVTVSQTNVIRSLIEQTIPDRPLVHLLTLRHNGMEIVETTVSEDSLVVGQPLTDIKLPLNVVLSAILRDGEMIIPNGATILWAGDEVIAVAERASEAPLRRLLAGS
ncbi:MAG: NAD-binding protein [Chloroflexota bacterium]|nr:NAD-binding protein [Chloroflexota bacterium]